MMNGFTSEEASRGFRIYYGDHLDVIVKIDCQSMFKSDIEAGKFAKENYGYKIIEDIEEKYPFCCMDYDLMKTSFLETEKNRKFLEEYNEAIYEEMCSRMYGDDECE